MARKLDPQTLIRPSKFAHVVLRVRDVAASADWYARVVGMETVFGNDFVQFMTFDAEHHRLALVQTPVQELPPPNSPGMDHIAYTLDTLGELLSTYRRLEALDIKPVLSINHGPTTSLYYEDPDRNRVEFQYDNFDNEEDLKAFLRTDTFAKNPIGVEFDPDALIVRYERGDRMSELVRQGAA